VPPVIGVIGVVGVVVVVVVVAVVSIPPGHRRPSDAATVVGHVQAPRAKDMVTTTTTEGPAFAPLRPTTASPLRVLEIGDSLGIDLGDQLQSQFDATGLVTTTVAALGDTGLANLSYYDWPAQLVTLLAT
jgi:hypothetical protein